MWAVLKRSSPLVNAKIDEGSKAVLARAAEVFNFGIVLMSQLLKMS
jgi:hypothetical protein